MTKDDESPEKKNGAATFFGGMIIAFVLLYISGWYITWGEVELSNNAFLLTSNGFSIRVNEFYYGASFGSRFFDAPAISWILLFMATGCTPIGFFFASSSSD